MHLPSNAPLAIRMLWFFFSFLYPTHPCLSLSHHRSVAVGVHPSTGSIELKTDAASLLFKVQDLGERSCLLQQRLSGTKKKEKTFFQKGKKKEKRSCLLQQRLSGTLSIYTCMCVCVCVCMCAYMHMMYMIMYVSIAAETVRYVYIYMHVCLCVCMYVCIYAYDVYDNVSVYGRSCLL